MTHFWISLRLKFNQLFHSNTIKAINYQFETLSQNRDQHIMLSCCWFFTSTITHKTGLQVEFFFLCFTWGSKFKTSKWLDRWKKLSVNIEWHTWIFLLILGLFLMASVKSIPTSTPSTPGHLYLSKVTKVSTYFYNRNLRQNIPYLVKRNVSLKR